MASRPLGWESAWPTLHERPDVRSEAIQPAAAPGATPGTRPWSRPTAWPLSNPDGADAPEQPRPKDATFPRSYARFEMNKDTQRLSIKIVDAATDEVIREIPSDEVQRIASELQAMARRGTIGTAGKGQTGSTGDAPAPSGGVDRHV